VVVSVDLLHGLLGLGFKKGKTKSQPIFKNVLIEDACPSDSEF
jgi:hypothetical protein